MAYEAEDTTEESLEFLKDVSPLFYKYLRIRMGVPMTLETVVTLSDGDWDYGIYIRDEHNAAIRSVSPDGTETRLVYSGNMIYQIEAGTRSVFNIDTDADYVDSEIENYRLKIPYDEVISSEFTSGTETYNGVEYNYETVADSQSSETYYFDKETDELVYLVSDETVRKIVRLTNDFDKESVFDIPADYQQLTFDDLMAREEAAAAEQQSSE